jgi:putative cardiolipin synthase
VTRRLTLALLLFAAATTATADVYRILDDPRDAAQARVDLFQQAKTQITALYFLARNDRVSLTALALMRDARRRGVRVRLIVDANFTHIPKPVLSYLRDEGVEVKVYHPLTLRHPTWVLYRMHEKVVIADGRRYITGGRNLAESYFGRAKKSYVDRDVYVDGESADAATRHFENLWASHHVADLHVRVSRAEKSNAQQMLELAVDDLQRENFIALDTNHDWSAGQPHVESVDFLHDPVTRDDGPRVGAQLAEIIRGAKKSILIESPYLVPSRSVRQLLEDKLREGVAVMIVTNSLVSSDGVLPVAAYLKYRRRLVRAGIDLREYKGPDVLHAKSLVIDGRIAIVGSYNVDRRSENLNTEVMCVAQDERAAEELTASIHAHADNAWKVRSNGTQRAARDRAPSRVRKFGAWAARLLLPLIEGQL